MYNQAQRSSHVRDVVEAELVDVLGGRNNADPVTERVLLQELFGKVLDITFRERDARSDSELGVSCNVDQTQTS